MSSIFGWDYPPGCNSVPGDETTYCEVCGKDVDHCVCPVCPVCFEQGDKRCYGGTQESIKAAFRSYEIMDKLRDLTYKEFQLQVDSEERKNIEKEREKLLEEFDALDFLLDKGHGLEITQAVIDSINEEMDALEIN